MFILLIFDRISLSVILTLIENNTFLVILESYSVNFPDRLSLYRDIWGSFLGGISIHKRGVVTGVLCLFTGEEFSAYINNIILNCISIDPVLCVLGTLPPLWGPGLCVLIKTV